MGPGDYGIFSSALAQCVLLSQVAGLGLQTFWLSVYGKEGRQAARWMPGSLRLLAASSAAAVLALLLIALFNPSSQRVVDAFFWMTPSILGFAAVELVATKLQLEERFTLVAVWQMLHHAIRFVLIIPVFALADGDTLLQTSAAYSLTAAAIVGVAIFQIGQMARGRLIPSGHLGERIEPQPSAETLAADKPSLRRVFGSAWPYGADSLLYLAYFQCSNILLLYLAGEHDSGIYFAAFTIMNAAYLLPTTLYTRFLLSKLHRWAHHDHAMLLKAFKIGSVSMLAAGLICGVIIWLTSNFIIYTLYGAEYKDTATVLAILAACAPIRFLSTSIGAILTTGSQMRMRVVIKTIGAALCIILNILLIPKHGAAGAAVATVATELGLLILFSVAIALRRATIFQNASTQRAR